MLSLKEGRENARESIFWCCYGYAVTIGRSLDIEPDMPRIAGRQIHRANASASTPLDYDLQSMCLPLLDHLIEGLNTRFDNMAQWSTRCMLFFHQWLEWGKWKEIVRSRKLSMHREMIYRLPEMPFFLALKNTQCGKDEGKLFQRKIYLFIYLSIYLFIYSLFKVDKKKNNI